MAKQRADVLLVERGLAESREQAQRFIRAGLVHTESERIEKPGRMLEAEVPLTVKGRDCPFVSRGGLKLQGALEHFGIDARGRVALDLGASTGGFTDCLLQRGARLVYAIDVGRGQLHERIMRDDRVISRERTHLDLLQPADFPERPTLIVADLSFISITRSFPVIQRVAGANTEAVLLIKPQFEVGREQLPRGGVLRDEALQRDVLDRIAKEAQAAGFEVRGACDSPITGGDGNREFFLWLRCLGAL